jgi:predicted nucleic acid-binding protein
VIVNDRYDRAEARSQGVAIIGTAAVLVLAKERNLIPVGRGQHAEPFLVLRPGDEAELG